MTKDLKKIMKRYKKELQNFCVMQYSFIREAKNNIVIPVSYTHLDVYKRQLAAVAQALGCAIIPKRTVSYMPNSS